MKRKYKIGIEVQRLFREKKHGMEVVALELIKEIQEIDHHNDYILYVKTDRDINCLNAKENFLIKSLPAKSYVTWEQFAFPLQANNDQLNLIHSTCNTSSIFLNMPRILTLHDIIYLERLDFQGSTYQNFGNIYRRMVVPYVVKHSKSIITVSNYEKEKILRRFNIPDDKVKVIYNAVSSKFHTGYSEKILEDFRINYRLPDKYILFLGNTAPKKNTKNVIRGYIEYLSVVPDGLPLVILDYEKTLVRDLLISLNKIELIDKFVFPGYVASDSMPLLYNMSSLFLYPSLRESFGLPILEAMASGTPVLTSNTSAMPEVAGGAAMLVDPFDYSQIKEGIMKILNSHSIQTEMRRNGLKRAKSFNWRSSAEQLVSLYHSIIY